ncbi:MAG: hypothetical protein ACLQUZ_15565 [Rhizomicrobium sp.]
MRRIPGAASFSENEALDRVATVRRQLRDRYAQEHGFNFDDGLRRVSSHAQSPIEAMMALGLYYVMYSDMWFGGDGGVTYFETRRTFTFDEIVGEEPSCEGIVVWPQATVGPYRADFVIRYADWRGGCVFGAIECDGHDHHDLTKRQAQHDRQRDRHFQELGLLILWYPGSEVWHDPLKSAVDALSILAKRAKLSTAPRWRDDPCIPSGSE